MKINRLPMARISTSTAVQFSSVTQSCPTLCNPMNHSSQASLSIAISRSSLKLTSIESAIPTSHLILCCPLFLLPPIPPSISLFQCIIPSKEHPGLISFRMDWLDLLAVHGTLKSLLQYHSSKASKSMMLTISFLVDVSY